MSTLTPDIQASAPPQKPDVAARRMRLREFQSQLVERMKSARSAEHAYSKQLGVVIGGQRWLLNLQAAGEIVSVGAITGVPLTQPWFLGLANVRGSLISVIDFAGFQGLAPTTIDADARIVAFSPALSFNSGLLVSKVLGLRNVDEMEPQTEVAGEPTSWSSKHYLDRNSQCWSELDVSLLIQNPRFLQVSQ